MQIEETEILQDDIDLNIWFFDIKLQELFYEFDRAMEQGYLYE